MRLRILTAMLVSFCGFSALSQSLPDTVRVSLVKLNEPLSYCEAYWMTSMPQLVQDPTDSTRIIAVHTNLFDKIPLTIDFSNPDSVTYRFPTGYSDITVSVDSMKIYRQRNIGQTEGSVPNWKIGTYRNDNINFDVWACPDGNIGMPDGPTKFLDDFVIKVLIGNKHTGTVSTPAGPFSLTVHHPSENPGTELPYPAIIPEGKYEDFSNYIPQITNGVITTREREPGSMVKLGANDFYLIDSITPGFDEVILTKCNYKPKGAAISEDAMAELKPFLDAAASQGKLLLVDFWGTWCRPCLMAMPKLKAMEEKFADRIAVLSVIVDDPQNFERGKEILDKNGLTGRRLFREDEPLADLLSVTAFPMYILLDKDGSIIMKGSSAQALDWLERQL